MTCKVEELKYALGTSSSPALGFLFSLVLLLPAVLQAGAPLTLPLLAMPLLQSSVLVLLPPAEDKQRGFGLGVTCRLVMVVMHCKA